MQKLFVLISVCRQLLCNEDSSKMFMCHFVNFFKCLFGFLGIPLNDADAWWAKYQPEVDATEQCGSMFYTGRLTHIDCILKSFFICEHEVDNSNSTKVLLEEQSA